MIEIFKSKIFLFLISLIFVLFYIYKASENKGVIIVKKNTNNKIEDTISATTFKNVSYNFTDENARKYTINANQAELSQKNPEIINLTDVIGSTKLKDNSYLKIKSKKANFFKFKKNIFFYENVLITNKDIIITGTNANYIQKKNTIEIFNNVILKNSRDIIKCDRLVYDIVSKDFIISMDTKNRQINGKRQ